MTTEPHHEIVEHVTQLVRDAITDDAPPVGSTVKIDTERLSCIPTDLGSMYGMSWLLVTVEPEGTLIYMAFEDAKE